MAKVEVYGMESLINRLEQAQKNIDDILYNITVDSMKAAGQDMKAAYEAIPKKQPQGKTIKSYDEEFNLKDGEITGKAGFQVSKGGIASVFFNYGTPYIQPHYFVQNAKDKLYKTLPDKQRQAIIKEIEG